MPFQDRRILVSVLLAARNEEANIERCLESLNRLNFPNDQIEICIGDDDSSDNTQAVIKNFIQNKSQFRYFHITENLDGLRGKTNVLAQLAHEATGEYFFYCDADISVPNEWINSMLNHFKKNTGIVIGLTRMKKSNFFADLLSLEWLFTLTIMRFFSLLKIPLTGLGNNMAVTKEAYESVGGYEKIGFSIVEDYALFKNILLKKYDFVQTYTSSVVAFSESVSSFKELKIQRKRWIHGIMQSPLVLRVCVIFSASLLPAILLISIWDPERSINMAVSVYIFLTAISMLSIILLKQKDLWKTVFFFWFYLMSVCLLMLIIYFSPGKTFWKGREY